MDGAAPRVAVGAVAVGRAEIRIANRRKEKGTDKMDKILFATVPYKTADFVALLYGRIWISRKRDEDEDEKMSLIFVLILVALLTIHYTYSTVDTMHYLLL